MRGQGRKRALVQLTLDLLRTRYPHCFNSEDPRPLKVGIGQDLRNALPEEVSLPILHDALAFYVGHPHYLGRVKAGAVRIDLDGNPAGLVQPDEAEYAAKRLERLRQAAKAAPPPPSPSPPRPSPTSSLSRPSPAPSSPPPPSTVSKRGDGFAGLKAAAKARSAGLGVRTYDLTKPKSPPERDRREPR
jgi:ProP effector